MPFKKLKTSRLLDSFQAVLRAAREKTLSVCIAFVDNKGRTQMLWRERGSDIGWLNRAEAAAFTSVTENVADLSLNTLELSRAKSNEIYHFEEKRLSAVPITGGRALLLDGNVVGAVAIIGSDPKETERLLDVAMEAYAATPVIPTAPVVPMPDEIPVLILEMEGNAVVPVTPVP